MDKCCLCNIPVSNGGILLCKKHWEEYSEAAKGDFKYFQVYRKKIEDALISKNQ